MHQSASTTAAYSPISSNDTISTTESDSVRESNNDINTTCVPIDKRLALYHLIALENKLRVYHHLCSGQSDIGQTEGLTATNT